MHRRTDTRISATAAKVAVHRSVYIGVTGLRIFCQKRGCRHHLPRLAIAALGHLQTDPCRLHGGKGLGRAKTFDGGHLCASKTAQCRLAGTARRAIDQHRAGAAKPCTATEFRPLQPDHIPQGPQKRHIGFVGKLVAYAVDIDLHAPAPLLHRKITADPRAFHLQIAPDHRHIAAYCQNVTQMPERRYPAAREFRLYTRIAGVDVDRVLQRAGMSPGLLKGNPRGVTAPVYFALWEALVAEMGGTAGMLDMPTCRIDDNLLGPDYRALTFSPNLLTAIQRLEKFSRLAAPISPSLTDCGDFFLAAVDAEDPAHPVPLSIQLSHFNGLLRVQEKLTGVASRALWTSLPDGVELSLPPQFGHVKRGTPMMAIARADLERPIPSRDDKAWLVTEAELQRDRDNPLSGRVRMVLRELLPSGEARAQAVARELFLSQRTFQRQLASENTSFQALLDEVRADLAHAYLRQDDLTIEEIAYLLAYRDTSSFFRAFQHWTGMTPGKARKRAA